MEKTIGKNVKYLREKLGLTQQSLADFLGISREEISYFETGARSIPTTLMTKIADLFCIEEYDLYEEDNSLIQTNVAFAFRAGSLSAEDINTIASFKKIAINYLKMQNAIVK